MVLVEGSDNSSFDKLRTSGVVARIDLFRAGGVVLGGALLSCC